MKIKLELNIANENTAYLNFWNWETGKDVILELKSDNSSGIRQTTLLTGDFRIPCSIHDFVDLVKCRLAVEEK